MQVPAALQARALWRLAKPGLPYAAVLAVALATAVTVGANLSNATPSKDRPFGWPGPASFEGGVATVRTALLLVASLPGLLWGIARTNTLELRRHRLGHAAQGVAADAALLACAIVAATAFAAGQAAASPSSAYVGFAVAHAILAGSFYAIGTLCAAVSRRAALPAGLAAWVALVALVDDWVRWRLFREAGYDNLAAGHFPSWFYASQAATPLAGYRATLILWRPGFRDYVEHAALDKASLPAWMTAGNLALATAALWIVLPLALAAAVWHWRTRRDSATSPQAMPAAAVADED